MYRSENKESRKLYADLSEAHLSLSSLQGDLTETICRADPDILYKNLSERVKEGSGKNSNDPR